MFPRAALVILALILLVIVFVAIRAFTSGPFKMSADQMRAGSAYIKSLKDDDVQPWIDRTRKFLSEYDPKSQSIGVYGMESKPIPSDLQQLKIIRIDISPNQVRYVWMAGIAPRSDLEVERLPDGSFTLTAHYSDTQNEVIWPRTPNQSLQPTASPLGELHRTTSTTNLAAQLVLISGGSACFR